MSSSTGDTTAFHGSANDGSNPRRWHRAQPRSPKAGCRPLLQPKSSRSSLLSGRPSVLVCNEGVRRSRGPRTNRGSTSQSCDVRMRRANSRFALPVADQHQHNRQGNQVDQPPEPLVQAQEDQASAEYGEPRSYNCPPLPSGWWTPPPSVALSGEPIRVRHSAQCNGEVEGPRTSAGHQRRGRTISQRRRRQSRCASRTSPTIVRPHHGSHGHHKNRHFKNTATATGTANIRRKIGVRPLRCSRPSSPQPTS